jgi:hypothetical protein
VQVATVSEVGIDPRDDNTYVNQDHGTSLGHRDGKGEHKHDKCSSVPPCVGKETLVALLGMYDERDRDGDMHRIDHQSLARNQTDLRLPLSH